MTVPGQFAVNATGAATYSIPIAVPPGTAGMVPSLALDYSSQGLDGIVGVQWSLDGLPSIARCPRTLTQDGVHGAVNFDANDRFCLNGQRLIATSGTYGANGAVYRTEIDGFVQVISYGSAGSGPAYFKLWTKSGQVIELGNTTDSRLLAVGTSTARIWSVNKITDTKGNYLTVTYTNDSTNGQIYPARIDYTGNAGAGLSTYNSVQFTYNTSRADVTPTYQAGSLQKTTVLLTHIKTYAGASVVYDYQLGYRAGTTTVHSRLTSVTLCDGSGTNCLAPTSFGWQGGTGQLTMTGATSSIPFGSVTAVGDFNADGLVDIALLPNDMSDNCGSQRVYFGPSWTGTMRVYPNPSYANTCSATEVQGLDLQPDGFGDILVHYQTHYCADVCHTPINTNYIVDFYNNGTNINSGWQTISPTTAHGFAGDFDGDGRSDIFGQGGAVGTSYVFFGSGAGIFTAGPPISGFGSTTETLYAADFDGDGCTDLLSQGTTSAITYFCNPATSSVSVTNWSGSQIVLGDFNGDGKTDVLIAKSGSAGTLYLSTGTGLVATSFSVPTDWGKYTIYTADWNGDGKTDILLVAPGGTGFYGSGTSHKLYLSTGSGFVQAVDTSNNPITISNSSATVTASVADWNNDGAGDFVLKNVSGNMLYTFSYVPEQMTSVSNGAGATTTIAYDRLNKNGTFYVKGTPATYPVVTMDGAFYVVSQVGVSNGIGGTYTTSYSYGGAFANNNTYTFANHQYAKVAYGTAAVVLLGFNQITATDSQTGIVTTTNYHSDFPYVGMVSSQTRTLSGVTLSSVSNTYASAASSGISGTHYYFVYLSQSVASGHDIDGSAFPTTTTNYTYDAYGNATTVAAAVSDGSSRTATNTYTNDTTNWILGQLTATSVESIVGLSDITRASCYTHDSGSGLVTRAVVQPAGGSCTYSSTGVQTDYTLDSFGHSTAAAVSGPDFSSRTTSAGYDALGEFQTSAANALSQSESWTYTSAASLAFGAPTDHTGPNGLVTAWSYDSFGRPTLETRPDGTKTATSYAFCAGVNGGSAACPTYGAYLARAEAFASDGVTQIGPVSTAYYDALGRVIARDTQGFDGSNVRVAVQYDANGNTHQTSRPYFTAGTPTIQWTVYADDALGRVTQATMPDGSVSTAAYHGLTGAVTNDKSQTVTTLRNAQGLVQSVTDAATHVTSYTYDAWGDVLRVTDPAGNAIANTYDTRGRKTASSDPDMGSWSYGYDALSELTSQTDAKGQVTTLSYDLLGRALTRGEPGLYSAWTFGTSSAGHNVGQLIEAKACTDSGCGTVVSDRTIAYDGLGRATVGTLTVGGTGYTTTTSYDAYGRVSTVAGPSGFTSRNVYTALSYLCRIADTAGTPSCTSAGGANVIWTANTASAELALTQTTAGNGVVTTNTFDATTGRLTNLRAGPSDAVASFDYQWDSIGNLIYRSDNDQGVIEKFCYDGLNRLTNSATGASGIASCTASGTGITTKTVGYDNLGNITSKSDVGTYSYPGVGSAQPHGVSSIAGTVNGVTNPAYTYDANGNMTAGAGRSITYTAFNMADTITQGTTTDAFTYDDSHARVTQVLTVGGVATTTTYLNDPVSGAMGEKVVTGGTTTWHDFIQAGGVLVAERFCTGSSPCSSGATWAYFVTDHLGSASVLTDGTGAVTERDSYDAWGRRRNPDGTDNTSCAITSATTRGYTGHEMLDTVCQVDANARIYDPTIGRFNSADPYGIDQGDGQSFNRYSYVQNGPLSATDPSGYDVLPGTKLTDDMGMGVSLVITESVRVTASQYYAPLPIGVENLLAPLQQGRRISGDPSGGGDPPPLVLPNGKPETVVVDAKKSKQTPPHDPVFPTISPNAFARTLPSGIDPSGANGALRKPQKMPCSARTRIEGGGKAVWHSLDAAAAFGMGTAMFAAGGAAVGAGCIDPTPFEPGTCALGGFAAAATFAGGSAALLTGGVIVNEEVLPDINEAICKP